MNDDDDTNEDYLARQEEAESATVAPPRAGCCVDGACRPNFLGALESECDCMLLPYGVRCGDCAHVDKCKIMFGKKETDDRRDWFPRKFRRVIEWGRRNMVESVDFWVCDEEAEVFHCKSKDEAIEEFIDKVWPDVPARCTVLGFRRREVDPDGWSVLDDLLERMDDEYGIDDYTEPTDAMVSAERAFIDAVLSEYKSEQCELVDREEVDLRGWIQRERPDDVGKVHFTGLSRAP